MKTLLYLGIFQAFLSAVSAWLMAQMSFIGKLGIGLFYSEYKILKSPVETGLTIFGVQMVVVALLFLLYNFASKKITNIFAGIILVLAVLGLGYTIYDFTYEFSHKILKTKFHIGFYLIWFGIIITCIIYLIKPKRILLNSDPSRTL